MSIELEHHPQPHPTPSELSRPAKSVVAAARSLPARALIFCIELYRTYVSPLRMPTCRFTPTCSEYAVEALGTHGAVKGLVLAAIRLLKCGPWHRGGWDPVPPAKAWRHRGAS